MAQSSHSPTDPLARIFAYRAIDLRDRFPQPLESFREALECLQSDRSYMAAIIGHYSVRAAVDTSANYSGTAAT